MSEINSEKIRELLANTGGNVVELAKTIYEERINKEGEMAFSEAIEIGIGNTIASLRETNASEQQIIDCLNKYWGIPSEEAMDRLLFEKEQAPLRELRRLLKLRGMASDEIRAFMLKNKVLSKLKRSHELRELWQKPEKLMKMVQEDQ